MSLLPDQDVLHIKGDRKQTVKPKDIEGMPHELCGSVSPRSPIFLIGNCPRSRSSIWVCPFGFVRELHGHSRCIVGRVHMYQLSFLELSPTKQWKFAGVLGHFQHLPNLHHAAAEEIKGHHGLRLSVVVMNANFQQRQLIHKRR